MSKADLRLDWCSHEAAKYAVTNWHYSRSMPMGRSVKVGAWEQGKFIGCVIFAQGNNQYHGKAFGLGLFEVCELVRVALSSHVSAVSRIVALALSFLKRYCAGIRLVVSYADPEHGHVGGIYQAGNWFYVGTGGSADAFVDSTGKRLHSRAYSPAGAKIQFGQFAQTAPTGAIRRVSVAPKHKYFMPLDPEMRAKVLPLTKPYPKHPASEAGDGAVQAHSGGAAPTRTLHV